MLLLDENKILEKSLQSGINMKFTEFVEYNDINLDVVKVDKFFHSLDNKIPMLLDETLVKYFGYADDMPEITPKQIRDRKTKQKEAVKKLFESNFMDYKDQLWWNYSSDEYKKFLCSEQTEHKNIKDLSPEMINKLYPLVKKKGQQPNYILIMPKIFKEALMLCNTTKGKLIRRFYIDMLDVFNLYVQFQNNLIIKSKDTKIDELLLSFKESEKKADIEREKSEIRFNKLLGIAENTNDTLNTVAKQHVEIDKLDYIKRPQFIIMKDPNDDELPYYAIRRQKESLQEAMDAIMKKFPSLTIWLSIPQPNAIAFFNIIKKKLGMYMVRNGSWFGIKEISPNEFKERVNKINNTRMKPPRNT